VEHFFHVIFYPTNYTILVMTKALRSCSG